MIAILIWSLLHVALALKDTQTNIIQGLCEWTVSSDGARTASVHVVRVYGCAHGRVTWERPHGGLEITFKSVVPVKTRGKYKVCVTTSKKNFNIFSRSKDKLQLLEGETNKTTLERCVSSHGRINTLYTEAPESGDSQSVVFQYRTTFLGVGHGALKQRECRLCSKKELIRSFCEDDFAVHGHVKLVYPIGGSEDRGEALVVADKVFHQTANIFQHSTNADEIQGYVNFPLYCRWKKVVSESLKLQ
ncbi:meteorin-like protein isoform X2 [Xenia sp. Carnegie-2017]|uniref:meteorin-like protein isoform X2 n=1 Tax=Xenia sp. Carnegie-2017 TaxID=2897299 RepID=UPI001F033AC7|nr:meteorin-like protein isoform X2 [Xenia sp. Carnegie-2017]